MKWVELFTGLVCGLIVAVSLSVSGLNAVRNPMDDRLADFELKLAAVTYVPEEYVTGSDANYDAIQRSIVQKSKLWKELVPPPPAPPPRKPKPPNLAKMLQGVLASSRLEITGTGGRTLVHVKTKEDPRGSWLGVGDEVKRLKIKEITKEAVVFSLISNNKEYTYSLPRR